MLIKKITSVLLAVLIMLSVMFGCFVITADAESTIIYSFTVKTSEIINAYEGHLNYPSKSLSVNRITFSGQSNDKGNGLILFNNSNASVPFDFSQGSSIITVEFNVLGDYNDSDISCELKEFYSNALVAEGNIPFDFENVINGEVVLRGHTDIDSPSNSYTETKYSVAYHYEESPSVTTTYTKAVWGSSSNAREIAELGKPYIENPYFKNYSVKNASFNGKNINAELDMETKMFSVSLNGAQVGKYSYLQTATVSVAQEIDFLINGVRVATGTDYSFFVTGDTDIITDTPSATTGESASVVNNALYLSDSQNGVSVKMEFLVSATSADFNRMGVAFTASPKTEAEIISAVNTVTEGTATTNKIAVHNSTVDNHNLSGQYQFIYAPYASVSKVNKDKTLYFYAYVVDNSGGITVSNYSSQVSFANVLA